MNLLRTLFGKPASPVITGITLVCSYGPERASTHMNFGRNVEMAKNHAPDPEAYPTWFITWTSGKKAKSIEQLPNHDLHDGIRVRAQGKGSINEVWACDRDDLLRFIKGA